MTQKQYAEKYPNPIGAMHFTNTGGIAIFAIEHEFDDYVISAFATIGNPYQNYKRTKIYNDTNRPYFRRYGRRYYFDEIMRV